MLSRLTLLQTCLHSQHDDMARTIDCDAHVCSVLGWVACVVLGPWLKHLALSVLLSDSELAEKSNLLRCTMG